MKKYLALVKDNVVVDQDLTRQLEEKNIKILQHFSNLGILTFETKETITLEDFDCFHLIEEDKTYSTQEENDG